MNATEISLTGENLEKHLTNVANLLKDTQMVIQCLQMISKAKQEQEKGGEVPKELAMGQKMLNSISLKLSLEEHHSILLDDLTSFLQAGDKSTDEAKLLETEDTDLLA